MPKHTATMKSFWSVRYKARPAGKRQPKPGPAQQERRPGPKKPGRGGGSRRWVNLMHLPNGATVANGRIRVRMVPTEDLPTLVVTGPLRPCHADVEMPFETATGADAEDDYGLDEWGTCEYGELEQLPGYEEFWDTPGWLQPRQQGAEGDAARGAQERPQQGD